jgi:16S rRNA processing protein RimM
MEPRTLIVGRVLGPHGVRGEMRVEPLTDDPERIGRLRTVLVGEDEYQVAGARTMMPNVLLRLEGIATRDQAVLLRGQYLRIPASEAAPLPEGSYYHFQLLGLQVATTSGESLGTVREVLPLASNDVYVVRGDRGEILVPAVRDVIEEIDMDAARIVVRPVPGLLPEEDGGR